MPRRLPPQQRRPPIAKTTGDLASVSELLGARYTSNEKLKFAFPDIDPGVEPFGSRVLVQTRIAAQKTDNGFIIPDSARDADKYNSQVALVRAIGPVAFRDRKTLLAWPEGIQAQPGMFVRIGKWGGDRVDVEVDLGNGLKEKIVFCVLNDLEIIGAVTGDPLKMKGYI